MGSTKMNELKITMVRILHVAIEKYPSLLQKSIGCMTADFL
jgi:hypothetical protein